MIKKIPIIKLSKPERLWLEEIYANQRQNKRIDYKEVWAKLYNQLPSSFRPLAMNEELVSASGEELRLLGVVALEKNFSVFKNINLILNAIKGIILAAPNEENIKFDEVAAVTKLSVSEASFYFQLVREFGFWSSASFEGNSTIIKTIGIGGNSSVFYHYIGFKKIENIVLARLNNKIKDANFSRPDPEQPADEYGPTFMAINPIFRNRNMKPNERLCFVLMPFNEEWSQRVYRDIIRENIEEFGLQCLRADDLTGQNIIEDIWTGINQASVIIADVTSNNPNVMYELGIVHTLGKPCILITQELENIPFDFRHLRHISYRENTEAIKIFKLQFGNHLSDLYKNHYPDTPIT